MNGSDGISLLGRETPAYILQEVRKRQLEDRGTCSLRDKLTAEYGSIHANFIVKNGMRLPTARIINRNRRAVEIDVLNKEEYRE